MKKAGIFISILLIGIIGIASGCGVQKADSGQQRIDLYVDVMKSAFHAGNGGDEFVAIKLDSLEGLSLEDKDIVLERFKDLFSNVYDFEGIKDDQSKFKFDGEDRLGTINGSLLWIELGEYKDNSAKIMGTSWFGNLGSVSIEYDAVLENGKWNLTEVTTRVS